MASKASARARAMRSFSRRSAVPEQTQRTPDRFWIAHPPLCFSVAPEEWWQKVWPEFPEHQALQSYSMACRHLSGFSLSSTMIGGAGCIAAAAALMELVQEQALVKAQDKNEHAVPYSAFLFTEIDRHAQQDHESLKRKLVAARSEVNNAPSEYVCHPGRPATAVGFWTATASLSRTAGTTSMTGC